MHTPPHPLLRLHVALTAEGSRSETSQQLLLLSLLLLLFILLLLLTLSTGVAIINYIITSINCLDYSPIHAHILTMHLWAALFSGIQYLAQGHSGVRSGKDWDPTADILVRGQPACSPQPPLTPLFSAQPNQSRQMAAHIESGSARGLFQLMREFFLSTVANACLLWELLGFAIIL